MISIGKYWPTIRQIVYGLLAAALAVAAGAGWITQDDADLWLTQSVTVLGALGFVVAGLFVDKTSPAQEQKIEQAVQAGIDRAVQVSTPVVRQVHDQVQVHASHIEEAMREAQRIRDVVRAEADRDLGR